MRAEQQFPGIRNQGPIETDLLAGSGRHEACEERAGLAGRFWAGSDTNGTGERGLGRLATGW